MPSQVFTSPFSSSVCLSLPPRADRKAYKIDRADALKEKMLALKARWQRQEDDTAATLVKEREEMDKEQAEVRN